MSYTGITNQKDITIEKIFSVHYFEYASNFSFEGARIAIVSDGDYAVEMKIYMADTGETVSHFWMMRDPDELKK